MVLVGWIVFGSSLLAGPLPHKILFYYSSIDAWSITPFNRCVPILQSAAAGSNIVTAVDVGTVDNVQCPGTWGEGAWTNYDEVWDMRYHNLNPGCGAGNPTGVEYFSACWQSTAKAYLQNNCGNLYLMAENSGFTTRNDGVVQFLLSIGAVGAGYSDCCGGATFNDSGPGSTVYGPVNAPFTGNFFVDFGGGIPLPLLNGTNYLSETAWSCGNGIAKSMINGWSGAAQMTALTGCNVGNLFMTWDVSGWFAGDWPSSSTYMTSFYAQVPAWFASHNCNCGTPTNTNTPTVTSTQTNTSTPTMTHTSTSTFTVTNTQTPTSTGTNTSTLTPTNTVTFTETATSTNTVTQTNTDTIQNTPTSTNTNTATVTATNTETLQNTATNSATDTPTNTDTDTDTVTNTQTATSTISSTNTATLTVTNTNTSTSTATNTTTSQNTFTSTSTGTNTSTASCTSTPSNTATPSSTSTMTSTPTSGIFMAKSVSERQVNSGDTLTYTIGVTVVGNLVNNVVVTDTLPTYMTFVSFGNPPAGTVTVYNSNTDLIQWTLPSPLSPGIYDLTYSTRLGGFAPANVPLVNRAELTGSNVTPITSSAPVTVIGNFTVRVNIYNSAGEVVRSIAIEASTQPINNISLSQSNQITTLQGPGSSINIIFDGYVIGTWDGNNNQGVPVSNGSYTVQVDNVGQTGVVTSVSQKVTVNRSLSNIAANVYNAAGELVRTLYYLVDDPLGSNMTNVTLSSNVLQPSLSLANNSPGAPNLATILIQTSGTPVTLTWDGTNNDGSVVTPGEYTIQIHWNDGSGQTTDISRTILVVASATITGRVVAEPNELNQGNSWTTRIDISQVAANAASFKLRVYAISGELVYSQQVNGTYFNWNASGLASGLYIASVEVDNPAGGLVARQFVKILMLH